MFAATAVWAAKRYRGQACLFPKNRRASGA